MKRENEYALLVKISEIMSRKGFVLSKMSLQQLVYIFQDFYSVVLNYTFELFTYGPYSVELIDDLDHLFSEDMLMVEYCQGPEHFGSKILPGDRYKEAYIPCEDFLSLNDNRIRKLIELLGKYNAHQLELRGALIYLGRNKLASDSSLVEKIQIIKPYFTELEIIKAVRELGLVKARNGEN